MGSQGKGNQKTENVNRKQSEWIVGSLGAEPPPAKQDREVGTRDQAVAREVGPNSVGAPVTEHLGQVGTGHGSVEVEVADLKKQRSSTGLGDKYETLTEYPLLHKSRLGVHFITIHKQKLRNGFTGIWTDLTNAFGSFLALCHALAT